MTVLSPTTKRVAPVPQPVKSVDGPHPPSGKNRQWIGPAAITAFWLANVLFVSLGGNFPLNDDWIFAESIQHFLKTGELRLLACAPACIFHLLFGAAACKVLGFSHLTLRCVGVFWAWAGTLGLYGCMRELKLRQQVALLFALTFAANPMTVNLAFSFMTDTPAFSLFTLYAFLTMRGMRRRSELDFVLATIALIAGSLVRQNMVVMAALNAMLLLALWLCKRHSWTLLIGLILLPLATGVLADKWMLSASDFTGLYIWYKGMVTSTAREILHAPSKMFLPLTQIAGELLCYTGLFCAPVLVCFYKELFAVVTGAPHKPKRKQQSAPSPAGGIEDANQPGAVNINNTSFNSPILTTAQQPGAAKDNEQIASDQKIATGWYCSAAAIITYALTQYVVVNKKLMPFSQNLLRMPAVGAHTLLGINHPNLPNKVRSIMTGVSGVLGMLLGALLGGGLQRSLVLFIRTCVRGWKLRTSTAGALRNEPFERRARRTAIALFVAGLCASQWFFVMIQSSFSDMDRYYLLPFLSSLLCLAMLWRWLRLSPRKTLNFIAMPLLAVYALYSASAGQDLMAWNSARWDAIAALERKGVPASEIDGGAEYNWYSNPKLFRNIKLWPTYYEFTHRGEAPRDQWRWWTVDKETYIISFSPVPGYEQVDARNYWSALAGKRQILVLKRISD